VAQVNDLSRSLTAFDPISTLVVVVEMSKARGEAKEDVVQAARSVSSLLEVHNFLR
jgi:hypothetical protein